MNNESQYFDDDYEHALYAFEIEDYKTAYKLFLPLAEQGDEDSQVILGYMFEDGHGVPQDYKEAVKWYRLSAEQGEERAQCCLGSMYYEGLGVSQDYKEAIKWWGLAAEQRNERAQFNLEMMHNGSLDCLNSPN